ncbi:uncharacterized protein LOC135484216 isoform X2 [Lineus longissimus]|uniref:uncharacterized protein LOC135484216 isoform X2 n=1 Tax=Lineus longissimus TaxID=88925 RepID=UPI002B4CFB20
MEIANYDNVAGNRHSSYKLLLNSIADDLDFLLNDLYKNPPFGSQEGQTAGSSQIDHRASLLEQYVAAGVDDDETIDESLAGRKASVLSAHLDIFGLDDEDKGLHLPTQKVTANGEDAAMEQRCNTGDEPRFIPLVERLIKTHSVWYLPMVDRAGAMKSLNGKEDGVFIVRQSSHKDTMALSFRFAAKPGGFDHYLIEFTGRGLRIEGSLHFFPVMPMLIAHYIEKLDELPCQLRLPGAILKANTSHELNSIALLGKDFWTSSLIEWSKPHNTVVTSLIDIQPYQSCPSSHSVSSPVTISDLSKKRITKDILLSPSSDFDTSDLPDSLFQVPQTECFMSNLKPMDSSGTGTTSSQNSSSSQPSMKSDGSMNRVLMSSNSPHVQKSELYSFDTEDLHGQNQMGHESFISTTAISIGDSLDTTGFDQEDSVADSGGESDISSDGMEDGVRDMSAQKDSEMFFKDSSPYCKGDFRDRLSDYEDVWTPTPDMDKKDNEFNIGNIKTTATKLNNNTELAKAQEEFRNNLNALTRALSLSTGSLNMHCEAKSPHILKSPGHVGFMNPGFGCISKQMSVESLNMNQDITKRSPLIQPYSKEGIFNPGFKDSSLDRSTMNSKSSTEGKITEVDYTFELPDVSQVTKRPEKLDIIPVFETKKMSYTSTLTYERKQKKTEHTHVPDVHVTEVRLQVNQTQAESVPVKPQKPRPPPLNLTAVNQDTDARLRKFSSPPYAEPVDAISPDTWVPRSPSRCPASPGKFPVNPKRGPVSQSTGPIRATKALSMHDEHGQLKQDYRPKSQTEVKPIEAKSGAKTDAPSNMSNSKKNPPIPPRIGWVRRRKSAPSFPLNANVRKLLSGKGKEKEQPLTVSPPMGRPPLGQKLNQKSNSRDQPLSRSEPHGNLVTNQGSLEFSNASNQHIKLHRLNGFSSAVQNGGRYRLSSPPEFPLRQEKPVPFPVTKEEVAVTKDDSYSDGTPPRATAQSESNKGMFEKLESIEDVPENPEELDSLDATKKVKPGRRRRLLGRPLSLKVEKALPQFNKKEAKRSLSLKKLKGSPVISEQLPLPADTTVQETSPKGSKKSFSIKGDKSIESLSGSRSSFGHPCSIFGCQSSLDRDCPLSDTSSFKSFSTTDLSTKGADRYDSEEVKSSENVQRNVRSSADYDDSTCTLSVISDRTSFSDTSTVEDLIRACSPQLTLKPVCQLTKENVQRLSAYDNLHCIDELQSPGESVATVFCKPWDSTIWENLLTDNKEGKNLPLEVTQAVQEWMTRSGSLSDVGYTPAPFTGKTGTASVADSWTYQAGESEPATPQIINPPSLTPVPGSPSRSSIKESSPRASLQGVSGHEPSPRASLQHPRTSSLRSTPDRDHLDSSSKRSLRNSCGIDIVSPSVHVHEDADNVSNSWVNLSLDERRPSFAMEAVEDMCLTSQSPQQRHQHLQYEDDKSDVSESFRNRIMPYLGARKVHSLRNKEKDPGLRIRDSISRLALDQKTTFGCTIENFNKCTIESAEMNPNIVMRNVRQFMSGIKNYLTKHGEGELQDIIERERNKLHEDEFLNIDAIIEGSLHKCVVKPLKQHIYSLFVKHHTKNGNLELLSSSIKFARNKSSVEIGLRPGLIPPRGTSLDEIKHYLDKMQKAYSPLKKLENLLGATSAIYNGVEEQGADDKSKNSVPMGADDFLPVFIYVIVQCGLISAEIEADYMWGLLHPSLLAGEGGYYLTTLSSAVHVLKNFSDEELAGVGGAVNHRKASRCSSLNDSNMQGVMKILIPDEKDDTIRSQPLPVRPNMSTKDVCSLIAHKFRVTNPQDYGLYTLVDKSEIKLQDAECPQVVKSDYSAVGMECRFAYKRNDAAFAWPPMSLSHLPEPFSSEGYNYSKRSTSLSHIRTGLE